MINCSVKVAMDNPQVQLLSVHELRAKFNASHVMERIRSGVYTEIIRSNKHPSRTAAREPFCTQSQIIHVVDAQGRRVASLHRYLRADGSLGASGRPDPKALLVGGVMYQAIHHQGEGVHNPGDSPPDPPADDSEDPE